MSQAAFSASPAADVDVAIIGGGVNGTGVARDCALRGLSVALFERNDIAFGASGNSSGLIHGGPRYLTYDPDVTYTSCLDSGHIQRIAPHLLFRVPFLMPVRRGTGAAFQLDLFDAFFSVYDRYQPLKRGKPHTRLTAAELTTLEPGLQGDFEGGVTFDEWGIDGVRLCVANALDAERHGAQIFVPVTATGLLHDDTGRVRGVRYRHQNTGETGQCTARVVVNATGAWAPVTAALGKLPEHAARLRPGKGIHVYFDRRLSNVAVLIDAVDGRRVFMHPWQNMSVIATTDDDYYGDLDNVFATTDEARYLIEAVARVFPEVAQARAVSTWAGVRPTLFEWGKPEDALSREHEIVDHTAHGASGLYSMLGGKLASYRLFAEEMSDRIAERLGNGEPCRTHLLPLPGGEDPEDARQLLEQSGVDPMSAARLLYRYGSEASSIAQRMLEAPEERCLVCVCEPVTAAEVRHVATHEWAWNVESVAQRTRLGLGSCGGLRCAAQAGSLVAALTGQSPEAGRRMAVEFLERNTRRRLPVLGADQLRQEAVLRAQLRAQFDLQAPHQTLDTLTERTVP